MQYGHPGAGAGATGGAVYGPFAQDDSVAPVQSAIRLTLGGTTKLYTLDEVHERRLRVLHHKLRVRRVAHTKAQVGQSCRIGGDNLQPGLLRLDQREITTTVDNVGHY